METWERLIKGAREMFFRYGVKAITMDDIAKQLGISKKTIYQFFPNKDSLICEVSRTFLKEQEETVALLAEQSRDPVDEILKLAEHMAVTFQNMNPSLLFEIEKYHPSAYKIYLQHKNDCIKDSIVSNLEKGIKEGLFRKELNVEILAILRMVEINMIFSPYQFPPSTRIADIQSQLIDHFLHGICTLKGHKLINKYKQIIEDE
jgi:AcrR family transcriptional regulator